MALRLGILGGTFDPVHLGHLRLAEEIGEDLTLHRVYLTPSGSPPHKTRDPVSPFPFRLAMTRLAAEGSPLLEAMDLEGRRSGLSYSIETLQECQRLFPGADLFFILGSDAFLEIETWKDYRRLLDHAHFVLIPRPGFETVHLGPIFRNLSLKRMHPLPNECFLAPSGKTLCLSNTTLMDISSTAIRRRVSENRSIRFLVPEAVRAYIVEKGLYRAAGG